MRKPRTYAEVYNDLDGEIVNVFRVLRDPDLSVALCKLLTLTPFARDEFEAAYENGDDGQPVERARRTIVKSFMGFGSAAIHDPKPAGMRNRASVWCPPTGFRSDSSRSGTTPAYDFSHYPQQLRWFTNRLRGVVIENRPAVQVIEQHDRSDTLHYVDPPYVYVTRTSRSGGRNKGYAHEMSDVDHRELAELLVRLTGRVVISGYRSELYDELYGNWRSVERPHLADGAAKRTEVLWFSPNVEHVPDLFSVVGSP